MDQLNKRLIDLEIKFTHQEELLDELNKIVAKQQLYIEKLVEEVRFLSESYSKSEVQGTRSLKDDIPPHY